MRQVWHGNKRWASKHGKSRDSKGKPIAALKSGTELFRKMGKLVDRYILTNKREDVYEEKVTDPNSGKAIHYCREKLSKHRNHGSAKKKNPENR